MKYTFTILILFFRTSVAQLYFDEIPSIKRDSSFIKIVNNDVQPLLFDMVIENNKFGFQKERYPKYFINILNPDSKNLIQSIIDSIQYAPSFAGVKFFDINADNYLDVALVREITMNGEPLYSFYLYNVRERNFDYSEQYSDLCCEMEIDTIKKEISIDYYDIINSSSENRKYNMTANEPVLTYFRTTTLLKAQDIDSVLIKEYKLINGVLKKVKEYKAKDEMGWE